MDCNDWEGLAHFHFNMLVSKAKSRKVSEVTGGCVGLTTKNLC